MNKSFLETSCIIKSSFPVYNVTYFEDTKRGNKIIPTSTFQICSTLDRQQEFELKNLYNLSMRDQISSILHDEINISKQNLLYEKYLNLGIANYNNKLNKWKKLLSKYLNLRFPIYTEKAKLGSTIFMLSDFLKNNQIDFCIVSNRLASIIKLDKNFCTEKTDHTIHIKQLGTLVDIPVYVNMHESNIHEPSVDIIIGRNTTKNNSGLYCIEYNEDIVSIPITENINELESGITKSPERICLQSRYGISEVGESINCYWAGNIVIGRKPLWRRFIFA